MCGLPCISTGQDCSEWLIGECRSSWILLCMWPPASCLLLHTALYAQASPSSSWTPVLASLCNTMSLPLILSSAWNTHPAIFTRPVPTCFHDSAQLSLLEKACLLHHLCVFISLNSDYLIIVKSYFHGHFPLQVTPSPLPLWSSLLSWTKYREYILFISVPENLKVSEQRKSSVNVEPSR